MNNSINYSNFVDTSLKHDSKITIKKCPTVKPEIFNQRYSKLNTDNKIEHPNHEQWFGE